MVLRRRVPALRRDGGVNVTFLHSDRLGSASMATDAAGNVLPQGCPELAEGSVTTSGARPA